MNVDSKFIKERLECMLGREQFEFCLDVEKHTLRIEERNSKQGVTLYLAGIIAKYEKKKDTAIDEVVYYVRESLHAKKADKNQLHLNSIFPVIRATSFPTKNKQGEPLFIQPHTAETNIFYVTDLGNTYRLLSKKDLKAWHEHEVIESSLNNLCNLPLIEKIDKVSGNIFYFCRTNDGYDASRVLQTSLLNDYRKKIKGDMIVSIPHQDVLIVADIQNQIGYTVNAEMTMSFFTNGFVPITSMSFLYENEQLEPIFVLGKH
jgi:uncharacterized protein YtpQ (UPF0354 family)